MNYVFSCDILDGHLNLIRENLTSCWTTISSAINSSHELLFNLEQSRVVEYDEFGRRMADMAADYARGLTNLSEGVGNSVEKQVFSEMAASLTDAINTLRSGAADAYAKYGQEAFKAVQAARVAKIAGVGGALVDFTELATAALSVNDGNDWGKFGGVAAGIGSAAAAGEYGALLAGAIGGLAGIYGSPLIVATFVFAGAGAWVGSRFGQTVFDGISELVSSSFNNARTWIFLDPLALDLDGDGIETNGINARTHILFDHNGDGIKTGSGWLKGDDAWLVLDKNGNGRIDNGNELFGADTVMSNGRKAANGFAALADLDSNYDGIFNVLDAKFSQVQIWRDLDQDGVSDAGELQPLAEAGISSINLNATAGTTRFANGNAQTATSTFTRADGSIGKLANLDLVTNSFYREFDSKIPLTAEAAKLPALRGAGMVRDLREAASIDPRLVDEIKAFRGLSRGEMMDRLDQFLQDWAHASEFRTSKQQVAAMGMTLLFQTPGVSMTEMRAVEVGGQPAYADANGSLLSSLAVSESRFKTVLAQVSEMGRIIDVLETFNGQKLLNIPDDHKMMLANGSGVTVESPTPSGFNPVTFGSNGMASVTSTGNSSPAAAASGIFVIAPLVWINQTDPLQKAYVALRDSVYHSLVAETRLKDYIDAVKLSFDTNGVSFDFGDLDAALDRSYQADPVRAFIDCLELQKCCDGLNSLGWQGAEKLVLWAADFAANGQLASLKLGLETAYAKSGSVPEVKVSASISTVITWSSTDYVLVGTAGTDYVNGANGNDILYGGAGNDYLQGRAGSDIYLFGRGSGQDMISNYDTSIGKKDVLQFVAGVADSDVQVSRNADDLILNIVGTTDKMTIGAYFSNDAAGGYQIDEIRFASGTVWTVDMVKIIVQKSTAGNDLLYGYSVADVLSGGDGSDTIYGKAGDDILNGDAGADFLYGDDGADVLTGGLGNDLLNGGRGSDFLLCQDGNDVLRGDSGDDILIGGAGNDTLSGDGGSDVYSFGRGDGQDSINNYDYSTGKTDAIQFSADIASADVATIRAGSDLLLKIRGSSDQLTVYNYFDSDATGSYKLEEIRFADGTTWDINLVKAMVQQATSGNDVLFGYAINDFLSGGDGNDIIYGRDGSDALYGDSGRDFLYGENGSDLLNGGIGDDVLSGGLGNDRLIGGDGNDSLRGDDGIDSMQGGAGNDSLYDWSGVSLFDGGSGNDTLTGGAAIEVYIGGSGNDTLDTGTGNDLILFNKGDGQDTFVFGGTGSDTLSIGGAGLSYDDLSLQKFADDLVLRVDDYDQITFKYWYSAPSANSMSQLQIIAESITTFEQGGSDPLKDQKIENFDFKGLVGAFDQARAANTGLSSWGLRNALDAFHTGGSDTMALGGDIAYQYGMKGSLDLVGTTTIFDVMSYAGFGIQPQPF